MEENFTYPIKGVKRESAESTKLRVVYDALTRAWNGAPSLNECLKFGPPLQNKLWSVLIRERFNPVAVTGDIKKSFLQVRIRAEDKDALVPLGERYTNERDRNIALYKSIFRVNVLTLPIGGTD